MDEWKKIYSALEAASIAVYPPAGKVGICTEPYCVVRRISSALTSPGQGWARYRITMLVPMDCPGALGELYEQVRAAMEPLVERGVFELAAPLGAVITDDDFLALAGNCDYAAWFAQ